jgi:hypothetical protein
MLDELRRTLNGCPSRKLGLVVTGAEAETEFEHVADGYHEPNRRVEAAQPPEISTPLAADHRSRPTRESRSRPLS